MAVYGKDWEKVPRARAARARQSCPTSELPLLYPSAKLVLDDTQGPTLPYGAVNARVFDALAAGTLRDHQLRAPACASCSTRSSRCGARARRCARQLDELLGDEAAPRGARRALPRDACSRATPTRTAPRGCASSCSSTSSASASALKIGAPNREVAPRWGDLHFAEALARELRRRGHRALVQTLDEWEDEAGLRYDVVVHLKGLSRYHPKPGQFNVLWSISHPAELTGEECDGYDLVCVASPLFADELRERTAHAGDRARAGDRPAACIRPDPDAASWRHELVYVANSRNVLRPIVRDLLPTEHDLAIWGANWEGLIDSSRVVAEHVPNDELRHVYSSAGIVLNDHWDDMREHGYISNRDLRRAGLRRVRGQRRRRRAWPSASATPSPSTAPPRSCAS